MNANEIRTETVTVSTVEEMDAKWSALPVMGKRRILAESRAYRELVDEDAAVLDSLYQKGKGHSVVAIINDIAILEDNREAKKEGERYPYSYVVKKDGKWARGCSEYFTSIDAALLGALGYKNLGDNNQFAAFASKMLGLKD